MTLCLDSSTKSLVLSLSSIPADEIVYTTHYATKSATSFVEKNTTGLSDGTADVTIIPAPGANETQSIKNIILYNPGTVAITTNISIVSGLDTFNLFTVNISANSSWKLSDGLRGEAGMDGISPTVTVLTQSAYDALSPSYDANTFYVING
jgi:hypothetical protein